jgi:hypothetical protein
MASVILWYEEINLLVMKQGTAGDRIPVFPGTGTAFCRERRNLPVARRYHILPVICLFPLLISRPKGHRKKAGDCQTKKARWNDITFHIVLN